MLTEQQRMDRLAEKKVWLAIVLSFIIPLAGYSYTERWKAFGVSMIVAVLSSAVFANLEKTKDQHFLITGITVSIYASIDNTRAVKKAKK